MRIPVTEVRIDLADVTTGDERVRAYCSFVFAGVFVVKDVRIVEGNSGLIVVMPTRPVSDHCSECGCRTPVANSYCGRCGMKLAEDRAFVNSGGRPHVFASVCHPISNDFRRELVGTILGAYYRERDHARLWDYSGMAG